MSYGRCFMELFEIIAESLRRGGADVFIVPGSPLMLKYKGRFEALGTEKLTAADTEILLREIYGMSSNRLLDDLLYSGDDDFSFSIQNLGRFRCSAYRQRGSLAAVLRVVSFGLPDPEEKQIPGEVLELADAAKGLIFVTGPAVSGKSTTLACMIDRINNTRHGHIVTIEDPIEYIHQHAGCIVSQREVRTDTGSFGGAIKAALRQNADVIMLGQMPDAATVQAAAQAAAQAAEMGRLVLAEGYIYGLSKLVSALVDSLEDGQKSLFRAWLSVALSAVVTQKLIPAEDGDVVPVFDVLRITPEIRASIREGEDLTRYDQGMDEKIYELWAAGRITRDAALTHADDAARLAKMIDG